MSIIDHIRIIRIYRHIIIYIYIHLFIYVMFIYIWYYFFLLLLYINMYIYIYTLHNTYHITHIYTLVTYVQLPVVTFRKPSPFDGSPCWNGSPGEPCTICLEITTSGWQGLSFLNCMLYFAENGPLGHWAVMLNLTVVMKVLWTANNTRDLTCTTCTVQRIRQLN